MAAEAASSAAELEELLKRVREQATDLEATIAVTKDQERRLRDLADKAASTNLVLTNAARPVNTTVNTPMEKSQRIAISRAKRKKGDRISAAINRAGLSKNDLAEAIGVTAAALSRYISGDRKIPKDRAEKIQEVTKGLVSVSAWANLATDDA